MSHTSNHNQELNNHVKAHLQSSWKRDPQDYSQVPIGVPGASWMGKEGQQCQKYYICLQTEEWGKVSMQNSSAFGKESGK